MIKMPETYKPILSELERIANERGYELLRTSINLNPATQDEGSLASSEYEIQGRHGVVSLIQCIQATVEGDTEAAVEAIQWNGIWPVENILPRLKMLLLPVNIAYRGESDDLDMEILANGKVNTSSPSLMLKDTYQEAFGYLLDLLEAEA